MFYHRVRKAISKPAPVTNEPLPQSRHVYVLDQAWKTQLLTGLPKSVREAFNAGFDAGFRSGIKKGRKDAFKDSQLRIPGT